MDIKLIARLSAYSKVGSTDSTLDTVKYGDIDTLFQPQEPERVVTKDEIDTLFKEPEIEEDIMEEDIEAVSFESIDSLFK